jgi:hypothetical protein
MRSIRVPPSVVSILSILYRDTVPQSTLSLPLQWLCPREKLRFIFFFCPSLLRLDSRYLPSPERELVTLCHS